MLAKINEIITSINTIKCTVLNLQKYIGLSADTTSETITGRLHLLENSCSLPPVRVEWESGISETVIETVEWTVSSSTQIDQEEW